MLCALVDGLVGSSATGCVVAVVDATVGGVTTVLVGATDVGAGDVGDVGGTVGVVVGVVVAVTVVVVAGAPVVVGRGGKVLVERGAVVVERGGRVVVGSGTIPLSPAAARAAISWRCDSSSSGLSATRDRRGRPRVSMPGVASRRRGYLQLAHPSFVDVAR